MWYIVFFIFGLPAKAENAPTLSHMGECMYAVQIQQYVKESIEITTDNNLLYLKGIADISKENPYFYYKFEIPQNCTGKPMIGYTPNGINILFPKKS